MPLKNAQVDAIRREYDSIRLRNRREELKRREEVLKALPEIAVIEDTIAASSVSLAKDAIFLDDITFRRKKSALEEKNAELSEQKAALLKANGYPADYLSPIYDCPYCKDTGMIGSEKCRCYRQKAIELISRESRLQGMDEHQTFDNFRLDVYRDSDPDRATGLTSRQNAVKAFDFCVNFARHFAYAYDRIGNGEDRNPMSTKRNILLYGNTGVGKTFLATATARAGMDAGASVLYLAAFALFDALEKAAFGRRDEEAPGSLKIEMILTCDLLVIDDLGTELTNAFTTSRLYTCINERLLAGRATVISTNLTLSELKGKYSERIFSRLTSEYQLLKLTGEDIRLIIHQ